MRWLILLAFLPLSAYAQQRTLLCPTAQPGALYGTCSKEACGIPASDTDIVLTEVAGQKVYQRLATVPPTGAMFKCGATPGVWTTRADLGLTPPPQATTPVPSIGDVLWWPADPLAASWRVYQGTASGVYGGPVEVTTPRYSLASLPPGKYYFAVSALGSTGTETVKSAEISFTKPAIESPKILTCSTPVVNGLQITMSCALQ